MSGKKKYLIIAGILFAIVVALFFFYEKDNKLKIFFLDVGQGDAILIRTPSHQDILIDGGPGNIVVDEIGRYLPFYDRDIELMILTHAHSDHISGLVEVLKRYQVDQVLYSGSVDYSSADYQTWLSLINEKKIPIRTALCCETVNLGSDLNLQILYPTEDFSGKKIEDLNDTSLVARLVFKKNEFLFTGDAPISIEEKITESAIRPASTRSNRGEESRLLDSDVLKVGHHGSKYSSGEDFLKLVDPEYAIISVGADNKFGHPHFKTINNLTEEGINILRTDQCGTVIFRTSGKKMEVSSEKCKVDISR